MKKCDECGKEAEELYFLNFNLPETLDENSNDLTKARSKSVDIWVCSECQVKFDNKSTEVTEFLRDFQKRLHRRWYEDKGNIEDLK